MHGLIMRAIQLFVLDCHGDDAWQQVIEKAGLEFSEFEAMMVYDADHAEPVLAALVEVLGRPREDILEDIGTYLVSHPTVEALRRLLRFGGVTFEEFLFSLDDLPDRARLAVSDLELPELKLMDHSASNYSLVCRSNQPGWGHVLTGALRTMADDYGALALVEFGGGGQGVETLSITLLETTFAEGRSFDLGAEA